MTRKTITTDTNALSVMYDAVFFVALVSLAGAILIPTMHCNLALDAAHWFAADRALAASRFAVITIVWKTLWAIGVDANVGVGIRLILCGWPDSAHSCHLLSFVKPYWWAVLGGDTAHLCQCEPAIPAGGGRMLCQREK